MSVDAMRLDGGDGEEDDDEEKEQEMKLGRKGRKRREKEEKKKREKYEGASHECVLVSVVPYHEWSSDLLLCGLQVVIPGTRP